MKILLAVDGSAVGAALVRRVAKLAKALKAPRQSKRLKAIEAGPAMDGWVEPPVEAIRPIIPPQGD